MSERTRLLESRTALVEHGSPVTGFGPGTLAVIWTYSVWQAYRCARARDFLNHQRWMIRNYSLTFAAVTLRLELAILEHGVGSASIRRTRSSLERRGS